VIAATVAQFSLLPGPVTRGKLAWNWLGLALVYWAMAALTRMR
jgi:hypothetical protein